MLSLSAEIPLQFSIFRCFGGNILRINLAKRDPK